MQGAARHLLPGGVLVVYGPFLVDGTPTAPGNLAFDADLRARNPAWGLRRLDDVAAAAASAGLVLAEQVAHAGEQPDARVPAYRRVKAFSTGGD